jgi:hypothetical protein
MKIKGIEIQGETTILTYAMTLGKLGHACTLCAVVKQK